MNIEEIYTLSDNLRVVYQGFSKPSLYIQIGDHMWNLGKGKITKRPHSLIPQESSEYLFYWVKE